MGFAIVAGGNPNMAVPVAGIAAGDIAVGSTVKLMESGTAVEYLVVNQGIPSNSNLYDSSCDGTWLLRKVIHSSRTWDDNASNQYASSPINTWLNGTFFNALDSAEQAAVKQVKIPYCVGNQSSTIKSGTNGLSVKAFLLSGYELGWTTSDLDYFPEDGAKLDYFTVGSGGNSKRIAYLNGSATTWWTRSPRTNIKNGVWYVGTSGDTSYNSSYTSSGIRPALVLPKTALFDETTLQLKGVA